MIPKFLKIGDFIVTDEEKRRLLKEGLSRISDIVKKVDLESAEEEIKKITTLRVSQENNKIRGRDLGKLLEELRIKRLLVGLVIKNNIDDAAHYIKMAAKNIHLSCPLVVEDFYTDALTVQSIVEEIKPLMIFILTDGYRGNGPSSGTCVEKIIESCEIHLSNPGDFSYTIDNIVVGGCNLTATEKSFYSFRATIIAVGNFDTECAYELVSFIKGACEKLEH